MGQGDVSASATGALAEPVVAVLPDGRRVLSIVQHSGLRLWDLVTGATLRVAEETPAAPIGHPADITCVTITPDGSRAVSGSTDGTLAAAPDGPAVITGGQDATIRRWPLPAL